MLQISLVGFKPFYDVKTADDLDGKGQSSL